MTTFKQALAQCRKVGTNHASGDSLRAMYASLVADAQGGSAEKYYEHLTGSDHEITEQGRALLRDRRAAWDILIK